MLTTKSGYDLLVREAMNDDDLRKAKYVDDVAFVGHHGITWGELKQIREVGEVILLCLRQDNRVIGELQIIFQPIEELSYKFSPPIAFCYGVAMLPEFRGHGLAKILVRRQEEIAKKQGVESLQTTIQVENYRSLRLHLGLGYVIYDYQSDFYGKDPSQDARLFLEKDLREKHNVHDIAKQPKILARVNFKDGYNVHTHKQIADLLSRGYQGVSVDQQGIRFVC